MENIFYLYETLIYTLQNNVFLFVFDSPDYVWLQRIINYKTILEIIT